MELYLTFVHRTIQRILPLILLIICFALFIQFVHAQQPKLVLPIGHTASLKSASFSPDGKKLVTASWDHTAKIWDAVTGKLLIDLKDGNYSINNAIFSKDGNKILTSSDVGNAIIWDAINGLKIIEISEKSNKISFALFSPDNNKIVTIFSDFTAKVWDASNGTFLAKLSGHTDKIISSSFSPDGLSILTVSLDNTLKIWDINKGIQIANINHPGSVRSALFSPDGNKIISASSNNNAYIWDVRNSNRLAILKGHSGLVNVARFSPDGKKIITASFDNTAKLWNIDGELLTTLKGHNIWVTNAYFSPNSAKVITLSHDKTAKLWDVSNGSLLFDLKVDAESLGASFSPDGSKLVLAPFTNGTAQVWSMVNGKQLLNLKGHTTYISSPVMSPNGEKLLTISANCINIWDVFTGKLLFNLSGHSSFISNACFSPDGQMILSASYDSTAKIWDVNSGRLIHTLIGHKALINSACFSKDGKTILTGSGDHTAKLWNTNNGSLMLNLKRHKSDVQNAIFSSDENKIITISRSNYSMSTIDGKKIKITPAGKPITKLWEISTGKEIGNLDEYALNINKVKFSPDGKKMITISYDSIVKIWDVQSNKFLFELILNSNYVHNAFFSPDNKKIFTSANSNKLWDAENGSLLVDFDIYNGDACFSIDSKFIYSAAGMQTIKMYDAQNGKLQYSFFPVDSTDYLVYDSDNRYDGSENARKLIYLTCNSDIIDLQQLKDKLWVPGLVERIMAGDKINNAKLSDLEICGLIPNVEVFETDSSYQYKIIMQRGELGETVLYVNGIQTKVYQPIDLKKNNNGYELVVEKSELDQYFVSGKQNNVSLRAFLKISEITSRSIENFNEGSVKSSIKPNLFAVMIGISDYKGVELDLNYATKDAIDISNSLSLSAGKLLGNEHIFVYSLNTGKDHYAMPEKKSIKQVFSEIGMKSTANDILLVFFAGHGFIDNEGKQFYFLTADASKSSLDTFGLKDAGISTTELTEWIKPQNIKAQKRILIFDACNSGQAINDFVRLGTSNQNYVASRNDDKAQQIKAIEKLNEKAGLFILAASASNQRAYEMGRYSQGLLTYALLKAIKQQPDILEDEKFLNVSRWFNAAEKIVSDLSKNDGTRQNPQIVSNTNFNIGVVDNEVLEKIVLADEKPLFVASNFQNNEGYDDLEISKKLNHELYENEFDKYFKRIVYTSNSELPDAFLLSGRYEVKADQIIISVNLRQNKDKLPKYKFEVNGKNAEIENLIKNIVQKSIEWIDLNK